MFRFNLRRAGGAAISLLMLVILVIANRGKDGDVPASGACKGIAYEAIAPTVSEGSVAFGLPIETRVPEFSALSAEEQLSAVKADELKVGCQYAAQAATQAIHRGILARPQSDQEWTDLVTKLDGDRKAHHELMDEVAKWDSEASAELVRLDRAYNSDWLQRRGSDVPLLIWGPGHEPTAGWVVRWTHHNADGSVTIVTERVACMYQIVEDQPPCSGNCSGTTTTTPPTTTITCASGKCDPGTTVPPSPETTIQYTTTTQEGTVNAGDGATNTSAPPTTYAPPNTQTAGPSPTGNVPAPTDG